MVREDERPIRSAAATDILWADRIVRSYRTIPPETNRRPSTDAVEAVVERYEQMMQRLIGDHAPEFTEVGITMAQAKVLYVVMAAGRLRLSELAGRLGIGTSAASEIVERLVELELLHRAEDPDDRRQVVITATAAAIELLERFRELNQRQLRELLGRLDADELAIVDRSLAIFHRAIDRGASRTDRQGEHRT